MSYSRAHYYVTFGGTIGGSSTVQASVEAWQSGCRFAPILGNPSNTVSTLLAQLDSISVSDILGDVTALVRTGTPPYSEAVKVGWAKVAVIDVDGHYAGDPKIAEQTPLGGVGGQGMPWPQLAWCVSLWSGQNLGQANRGRMYLPCPNQISPDPLTGQITPPSHVNSFRTGVRAMLEAINGEVATVAVDVRPSIMSKIGAGATKTISFVGVGPVMDTMRSRREALDDTVATWSAGWS